ncbi:hypothetical protein [Pseudomonas akapageensis]|uniref:hypothetical protein n=1 Tax=Pseudomonas akapageensis TaxID=2609961 RepID=UPI00140B7AA4|nr:hypothetical protein [Pseudomonas akapageensis]
MVAPGRTSPLRKEIVNSTTNTSATSARGNSANINNGAHSQRQRARRDSPADVDINAIPPIFWSNSQHFVHDDFRGNAAIGISQVEIYADIDRYPIGDIIKRPQPIT